MIALLEITAPQIDNPTLWLKPHLDEALDSGTAVGVSGGRTVMLIVVTKIKYMQLSVRSAP
jgi:hypothetical protein